MCRHTAAVNRGVRSPFELERPVPTWQWAALVFVRCGKGLPDLAAELSAVTLIGDGDATAQTWQF
jgi:hypothetical protein